MLIRWRVLLPLALILLTACSRPDAHLRSDEATPELRESCIAKAHDVMSSTADVLQIGHLSPHSPLDCVAVNRLPNVSSGERGIRVSRLVILRHNADHWGVVFDADRYMTNPEGYVGLDYLDDDFTFQGYVVFPQNKGSDERVRFTVFFEYLSNGQPDGASTEIGWNEATGRYQEFDYGLEGKFKSELKDPPRLHPGKGPKE